MDALKKPIVKKTENTCPCCNIEIVTEGSFEMYEQHGIPVVEKKKACSRCGARITDIYMLRRIGRRVISENGCDDVTI